MTIGPPQEPPGPDDEDELGQLQAEVGVYGSASVWQLVLEVSMAVRAFFIESSSLDIARQARAGETAMHWENVRKAREKVRELTDKTREQVQKEIETL